MKSHYGASTFVGLICLLVVTAGLATAGPHAAAQQGQPPTETVTLKIEGWTCASCEKDIRRALLAVPGVVMADVSYARGGAVVEVEAERVSSDQLAHAVAQASTLFSSYRAVVVPNGTLAAEAPPDGGGQGWFGRLFD